MASHSDRTYQRLRESIYRGDYRPGQRLVERDLASKLGTSRVPVRESLIRLESEGLVRRVPSSATFVEDLPPQDVLEIYSMRMALEPLATQLAAGKATKSALAELRRLCADMTRCAKSGAMRELDEVDCRFHQAIVAASGHRRLIRAYESAHIAILSSRLSYAHPRRDLAARTSKDHLSLVSAIARGQAALAYRLAHRHVLKSLQEIEKTLGLTLEDALASRG